MKPPVAFTLVLWGLALLVGVKAFHMTIVPEYTIVDEEERTVGISCRADTPLSACQFAWVSRTGNTTRQGPVLDFSNRYPSSHGDLHRSWGVLGYEYSGRGLNAGDCGVSLRVYQARSWVVWCRARAAQGGWKYNWMELIANNWLTDLHIDVTPRQRVVSPQGNTSLTCTTPRSVDGCEFLTPSRVEPIGLTSTTSSGRHGYHGRGLLQGDCGIAISNLGPQDSGFTECAIRQARALSSRVAVLTVARHLSDPILQVGYNYSLLTAKCSVPNSCPAAKITWLLNEEVIREDDEDDTPTGMDAPWRRPWENQPVSQTLTRSLTARDHGKNLTCLARHPVLTQAKAASKSIRFSHHRPGTCHLPSSKSVDFSCSFQRRPVNCSQPLTVGSSVRLSCKPGFFVADPNVVHTSLLCLGSGVWDQPVFSCVPDCGKRNTNDGETQIAGGVLVQRVGEFPWHVAVYELDGGQTYNHVCGGSLITPKVVLSAAHCFWSEQDGTKRNASLYRVAAGKLKRDWVDSSPHVQRRMVRDITVPERYHGRLTNFHGDVALARLTAEVDVTAHVNFVCVDWENRWERLQLSSGKSGYVTGWGYTEEDQLSGMLKQVELPFIDYTTCYNSLADNLKVLYTPDKFCAGYVNRSVSTCRGDSGGGLVFRLEHSDRYYLRGLVSVAFTPFSGGGFGCYSQGYTGFTLISQYRQWISDHV